jgi:putative oxygen-independent coproporphyrinogen III oxidase
MAQPIQLHRKPKAGETNPQLKALPPLSLYIHIPWCIAKCPYCDFNSHEKRGELDEATYVEALTRDLESSLPLIWGRRVYTIFFGGGTPSIFSPQAIDAILTMVRARLTLDANAEITLEANPGTFEIERFNGFASAGVNRLSLGIQSFDDRMLKRLGRVHDSAQARAAIETAMRAFDRVNLDVMYALPEQTMDEALADIAAAVSFKPSHISAYHLTLEPNTLFAAKPPKLPDDDLSADMQESIEGSLAQAGYEHYETSAFTQPGQAARHNLNYWTFGDYLGIGAGAHSKLSFHDRIERQMRYKQPKAYLEQALSGSAGNAVQENRTLIIDELPFEFMMNAMRLIDGVPWSLMHERCGVTEALALKPLREAKSSGFIEWDDSVSDPIIKPTLKGQRFLNELLQMFL